MRTAICVVLLMLAIAAGADDRRERDKAIEPTHWGAVTGRVYDAETGAPIVAARVSVRHEGAFADSGKTTGKTDETGQYRCQAMLGRRSSNLDIGRLLSTGLAGLILGGATNETKRIDVSRLPVRVDADGYTPYEGIVPCRALDAGRFRVTMEPLLLTKPGSDQVSTTAPGWGVVRVVDVRVEPAVLRPGDRAAVQMLVAMPPLPRMRDVRVACQTESWGLKDLKPAREQTGGILAFSGEFRAPRAREQRVETLVGGVLRCPYDIAPGADRKSALLQIVTNDAQEAAARDRAAAFAMLAEQRNVDAAVALKALAASSAASVWDLKRLAEVSETLHDPATAAASWKRIVDMTPEKQRTAELGPYARALVLNGDAAQAIKEYAPFVERVREQERPERVPLPLMVALGRAYMVSGKLERARQVADEVAEWPTAGQYSEAATFRADLRLAEASERLRERPNSAEARAHYGRVLMDMGRWDEAVQELREALKTDPGMGAVRRDLTYGLLHVTGPDEPQADLDDALAAAQSQVTLTDRRGKTSESKDFFAWHSYAVLLYVKARRQQAAGDPAAAETMQRMENALREALKTGRAGADVSGGLFLPFLGYSSPSVVTIAAFAYPQANADYVLLQSLHSLERDPNDYLSQFGLGSALIELGHADLAAEPIARCLALRPGYADALYAQALIALKAGDRSAAAARLRETLTRNPRHPRANLKLAELLTEEGDTAGAAYCLAAHARFYGAAP
ncbi:MAG: tetratricopeptide repeat protein [Chthonomonadales bacterium]|nr:tetratricopeptide repeat protein [Chthonomonadales bacterium]